MASQTSGIDGGSSSGQETLSELRASDLPSKRLIGKGMCGIVYETTWKTERYARKDFVDVPEDIFRKEASVLIGLEGQENIVTTHGLTVNNRSCSLVLEYMDDDLLSLLQKTKECKWSTQACRGSENLPEASRLIDSSLHPPLEFEDALDLMLQISTGMAYLHGQKIVHGDLKPRNVLVTYSTAGVKLVKVSDFGLTQTKSNSMYFVSPRARMFDMVQWKAPEYLGSMFGHALRDVKSLVSDWNEDEDEDEDMASHMLQDYFSWPEFGREGCYSDVYSFAVTCLQILTGEVPYSNLNWKELMDKLIKQELKPELPDAFKSHPLSVLLEACWGDLAQRPKFSDICTRLKEIIILEKADAVQLEDISQGRTETDAEMVLSSSDSGDIKVVSEKGGHSGGGQTTLSDNLPKRPVILRLKDQYSTTPAAVGGIASCFLQPFHAVCKAPSLVAEYFYMAAGKKGYLSVEDLTKFMQIFQGDREVTEEGRKEDRIRFVSWVEKTYSSRHLAKLVSSRRSYSSGRDSGGSKWLRKSRNSKQELLAAERKPTKFTLPLFLKFLLNPMYNEHRAPRSKTITEDMTAPLSHYCIFASHKTYLTFNHLPFKSSADPIVKALESGCRVIELDCWNGPNGKIDVTTPIHYGSTAQITLAKAVGFKKCVRAIKKYAFVASEYPLIVMIENHLSLANQKQAAGLLREILGEKMFIPSPSDRPPVSFLSPEALKNKIIISDKPWGDDSESQDLPKDPEFEELLYIHCQKPSEIVKQQKKGGSLVPGQHAIMANLSVIDIVNHWKFLIEFSKNNLGRLDLGFYVSSLDPMEAWKFGIQVAAISMQANDRAVWISRAFFSKNGGCGYVKKPDILLPGSDLDHEGLYKLQPKLELKVRVLMGTDWHRNSDVFKRNFSCFVEVAVHGIYSDAVVKQTDRISWLSGLHWDNEFTFQIRVPELAILRLEVHEYRPTLRDRTVSQSCVPVTALRQGIRVVKLQAKKRQPQNSKLLCHFSMRSLAAETSIPERRTPILEKTGVHTSKTKE